MEHLTNCHGEWNAIIAASSSPPFLGIGLEAKLTKEDKA